jgi:hypothetical protein
MAAPQFLKWTPALFGKRKLRGIGYANGLQFDFNYTLSHSIDNGSAAEAGAGEQGAAIQDIYNLSGFRGSSDFDIRNNINANFMYALPFGKDKLLLRNAPQWMDRIVSSWQVSNIWRSSTPLPRAVAGTWLRLRTPITGSVL